MYKFAHLADCHLGAQKYPELKELELLAFKECMKTCIEEEIDFIIIAGDLFHSNLPDMRIVKEVVTILRKVKENGINIYVTYGSHDFSPNQTSIIDIIIESGLMKKVFIPQMFEDENGEEKLMLNFIIDEKTNAKITGIPGRKIGIEEKYFEMLDRESLDEEDGFKIFVFHTAIRDFVPDFLQNRYNINLNISSFPKGFDYYAGGHVHKKILEENFEDYGVIAYPGPLFAGYPKDLEVTAVKNEKRGFFIVNFDEEIHEINFHKIDLKDHITGYKFLPFSGDDKNSLQLFDEIVEKIKKGDFTKKIVILKIKGKLSGGKISDINFSEIKQILREKGAIHTSINYHSLFPTEFNSEGKKGETDSEIEKNLLEENISNIEVSTKKLKDKEGSNLAMQLLNILRQNPKSNEKKSDYRLRIIDDASQILETGNLNDF